MRANKDDRAGSGTPSKRRKISTSETSPVGVATKIACKYRRMHHTRSPLSATARRLLLNKLHVGDVGVGSVDLSSLCHHTSSAFLSSRKPEYPELYTSSTTARSDGFSWCVKKVLENYPNTTNARERYFREKKIYKRMVKSKREAHALHHCQMLVGSHNKDPKQFWKLVQWNL